MTCRAILHGTGQVSIPLLLVRSGQLTPRQCDHEFKGKTGDCPTCQANIANADLSSGSSYAQAMLLLQGRGVGVSYRRFGYGSTGSVEPWRVCSWAHPPGYWQDVPFKDCANPDTDTHRVHLEVIRRFYEKEFPPSQSFSIKVEQMLRKPGDPPRPYCPDLAIYGPSGERLVAVEYQRSFEAYEKFADRDDLRRSEGWAKVYWWFDDTRPDPEKPRRTVYDRSQQHRTHLILASSEPIRCWVDPYTLKLQAEYGTSGDLPPKRRRRVERHLEKADLAECSTADLFKQFEATPEEKIVKPYKAPLRALAGSDLNFREDLDYKLERERRFALAVVSRQRRLEEQDRRHREWTVKKPQLDRISRLTSSLRLKGFHFAPEFWSEHDDLDTLTKAADNLQLDLDRVHDHIRSELEIQRLADLALQAAIEKQQAPYADTISEIKESISNLRRSDDHHRLTLERTAARLHEVTYSRHLLVQRQQARAAQEAHRQAERHWHPIEAKSELVRGKQVLKTLILVGDRIRQGPGSAEEIYQGVSGAGYSTDRHTYSSLAGWQIWKSKPRNS